MQKEEDSKKKNEKKLPKKDEKVKPPLLTSHTKRMIKAAVMFLVAVIVTLSFKEDMAGSAGKGFQWAARILIGQAIIVIPFLFFLAGFIFLKPKQKSKITPMLLGILVLAFGLAGILASQNLSPIEGGWLGYLLATAGGRIFGELVTRIIFGVMVVIGLLIFSQSVWIKKPLLEGEIKKPSLFSRIMKPTKPVSLQVKETERIDSNAQPKISMFKSDAIKSVKGPRTREEFILPPLDLLSKIENPPTSGNIKQNSLIIKKTLENFGIPVEMAEANVGPTVTQYAFKPAEGVKLSKITTLSNNLSLALAAHPIRIEAPIPGKALVGIEVPNKTRSTVCLRNLLADPAFQGSNSSLFFVLGRNVAGAPLFADITEMPHLLVAGSTGTGKTIFLNSLILSLLFRNTPSTMKLILVDPKRVEFQNYNHLPHLLCPVIYDATKTINALNWLVSEMQRRFEVFSEIGSRNVYTYNQNKGVIASGSQLPYIVLIVDELADLMAAKGREIETGVVRLAQMARATGIHLVLATQRPSVEVITGLIKANVTSRVTFQVASQIDSRTILDAAGAEKLLGMGDMLFISAKSIRPRRIQGPFVSEEEVRRVAEFIGKQNGKAHDGVTAMLEQNLKHQLESTDVKEGEIVFDQNDSLFEESKRIIQETKKASASYLQRRLKIGYARAARLIDMMEESGIVGPADGAKPREVYNMPGVSTSPVLDPVEEKEGIAKEVEEKEEPVDNNEWEKI